MKVTDSINHVPIYRRHDTPHIEDYRDAGAIENPAEQYSRRAGQAILESSPKPIMLLDSNQRFIARNATARLMLQARRPMFEENGRLCCAGKCTADDLRQAFRTLQNKLAAGETAGPRGAVMLNLDTSNFRTDYAFATLWAIPPACTANCSDCGPVTVLTVTPKRAQYSIDLALASDMFDLTPAESRLATLLVAGAELRIIAATQRLSMETVRAQLKSVFRKTNTHRQSEVVSLFLRLCY
jgi:DNA-binding CsgD family transcriptional regulator